MSEFFEIKVKSYTESAFVISEAGRQIGRERENNTYEKEKIGISG